MFSVPAQGCCRFVLAHSVTAAGLIGQAEPSARGPCRLPAPCLWGVLAQSFLYAQGTRPSRWANLESDTLPRVPAMSAAFGEEFFYQARI